MLTFIPWRLPGKWRVGWTRRLLLLPEPDSRRSRPDLVSVKTVVHGERGRSHQHTWSRWIPACLRHGWYMSHLYLRCKVTHNMVGTTYLYMWYQLDSCLPKYIVGMSYFICDASFFLPWLGTIELPFVWDVNLLTPLVTITIYSAAVDMTIGYLCLRCQLIYNVVGVNDL